MREKDDCVQDQVGLTAMYEDIAACIRDPNGIIDIFFVNWVNSPHSCETPVAAPNYVQDVIDIQCVQNDELGELDNIRNATLLANLSLHNSNIAFDVQTDDLVRPDHVTGLVQSENRTVGETKRPRRSLTQNLSRTRVSLIKNVTKRSAIRRNPNVESIAKVKSGSERRTWISDHSNYCTTLKENLERTKQSKHARSSPDSQSVKENSQGDGDDYDDDSLDGGSREAVYRCSHSGCGKVYRRRSHLQAHSRRHTGERPFQCEWPGCSWSFSRSDELVRHYRSHSGERPFICATCSKRFSRSDHLKKHLKVHMKTVHRFSV